MFPGLNPRKMQQMMKQMGIQQVDIPAIEVIIKTAEKEIVISNPSVAKVNMMGQETFQISGEAHERKKALKLDISSEDVKTVMGQAGVAEAAARKALEEHQGDLAEAIVSLTKSE